MTAEWVESEEKKTVDIYQTHNKERRIRKSNTHMAYIEVKKGTGKQRVSYCKSKSERSLCKLMTKQGVGGKMINIYSELERIGSCRRVIIGHVQKGHGT